MEASDFQARTRSCHDGGEAGDVLGRKEDDRLTTFVQIRSAVYRFSLCWMYGACYLESFLVSRTLAFVDNV